MDCSVQMFHHHNQWKRSTQSQSISLANMFYSFSLACMCVALMVYSKLTMIHNSSWMLAPTMFYILLVIYITYMYVHVHVRCVVHTVIITHVHVLLYCRFYSWKFLLWKRIQDTRHWKRLAVPVGGRLIGDRLIGYRAHRGLTILAQYLHEELNGIMYCTHLLSHVYFTWCTCVWHLPNTTKTYMSIYKQAFDW